MDFILTSTAFVDGQALPRPYTADDPNLSPPLKWTDPPPGTRGFVLLCEDPDAHRGTFTHWVVFNIPAEARELAEGVPAEAVLPNGLAQGVNDFGKVGYGGPAPPPGKPHRYQFTLFALDGLLDLGDGVDRARLRQAVHGHVRGEARLTGTYARGQGHDLPDDPLVKKAMQDRGSIYTAPLA